MTDQPSITGAQALARGAIDAGVSLVAGYPGAPATAVFNAVMAATTPDQVRVEWTGNEKVAVEMVFGASVGGLRSLLCVKGVGLNIALDPLMAFNLSGCNAGMVVLVGDDPGSWGSQNEQDSRALAVASELPLLEPSTVADAHRAVRTAFQLSEEVGLPVVVRITRALVLALGDEPPTPDAEPGPPPSFQREFMRWVVLPINVVPGHQRLIEKMNQIRHRFESSPLNGVGGRGERGIITAGFAYQKLLDTLGDNPTDHHSILRLGTIYPFPAELVIRFLSGLESVLVLEETAPIVERAVRNAAQAAGLDLPIWGRDSGHVPSAGEVFAPAIAAALSALLAQPVAPPKGAQTGRPMPSRDPLCAGCPYIPVFDALLETIERRGGRDSAVIVGDPGCMVRAQLPPYELLDVKHSLGSSISMAAGLALGLAARGYDQRVIALSGDSGFIHSGLNGLIDAARVGARMLVLILDNGTTALSGGQPHPASQVDARGQDRPAASLEELARAAGVESVRVVDIDKGDDVAAAIAAGIDHPGVAVVIARGHCPRWSS